MKAFWVFALSGKKPPGVPLLSKVVSTISREHVKKKKQATTGRFQFSIETFMYV